MRKGRTRRTGGGERRGEGESSVVVRPGLLGLILLARIQFFKASATSSLAYSRVLGPHGGPAGHLPGHPVVLRRRRGAFYRHRITKRLRPLCARPRLAAILPGSMGGRVRSPWPLGGRARQRGPILSGHGERWSDSPRSVWALPRALFLEPLCVVVACGACCPPPLNVPSRIERARARPTISGLHFSPRLTLHLSSNCLPPPPGMLTGTRQLLCTVSTQHHSTPHRTHSIHMHPTHPPTPASSSSATARPAPCVAASTSPASNSFLRRHPAKGANPPLPLAPPLPPPPPPPRPPPPLPTSHREPRRRCRVSLRFTHAGAMWS